MAKFGSALALLGWDQETNIPPKGVLARSAVRGMLSKKQFELLVSDELAGYFNELPRIHLPEKQSQRVVLSGPPHTACQP